MTRKLDLKKIVETMKEVAKTAKAQPKTDLKPGPRVRDMRQEAMDMGAHGANDYFKDKP